MYQCSICGGDGTQPHMCAGAQSLSNLPRNPMDPLAMSCEVESLQKKLDAANLQISDMKSSIQDLRDLLAEVPATSSRPFILGARRRLKDLDEKYVQKQKCACGGYGKVVGGDGNFYICPDCNGVGHTHIEKRKCENVKCCQRHEVGEPCCKHESEPR